MTSARAAVIALVTALSPFAIGGRADACSCITSSTCPTDVRGQIVFVATAHVQPIPPEPLPAIAPPADESFMTSNDDFHVGVTVTVVGRKDSPGFDRIRERTTLVVERAVYGMVRQQYQIEGGSFGMSCDYRFRDGEAYLVYATLSADGSIETSICTRTKLLRNADADLAYLSGAGTRGISGTVRGTLQVFDRKRPDDSIKVVLERPDGERLFEIESNRFDHFVMYPVPPGPYVLTVLLNNDDRSLRSKAILVAPGQCPTDDVELTVGTYEDWLTRPELRSRD